MTINNIEYELEPIFVNTKVKFIATSDYQEIYAINPATNSKHPIKLLNKTANAKMNRENFSYTKEDECQ